MSPDTLILLRDLLARQTVEVGAPDFEAVSARAARALRELDEAIRAADISG